MSNTPNGRTVLVADDDVGLVLLIERQLQREGFVTTGVSSGAQAAAWLDTNRADLLLLDFKLPDMTGQELIEQLAQNGTIVPFIVITGQGDERVAVDLMKRGASDYLIKDAALIDLLPVVVAQQIDRQQRDQRLVEAESALVDSEEKVRTLMESSPDIIMSVDRVGTITYINHTMLGFTKEHVLGASVLDLFSGALQESYRQALTAAFEHGRSTANEHPGPADLWYETRIVPIKRDGDIVTAMIVSTDVTERRRDQQALRQRTDALEQAKRELQQANTSLEDLVAELEQSNAELKEFAYVSSHDLQEPLRTMSSYCELLRRRYHDQLDGSANDFLDAIVSGAKRMQRLIEDLLSFSRVDRKHRPPEPVNLRTVVEHVLADLQMAISENDAHIDVGDLPTVPGDRVQLSQVFQNLIGNAMKFRSQATPRVKIDAHAIDDGWEIAIADNGIGIEPQYRERVFRIFQRLHPRDHYPGTGIGLAVCKKIIDRHGGIISIEDAPGGGTVVRFTIRNPIDADR